ncbi:MAG TPA: DUF2189 domain-containing protein [Xanthobacteraceae bacterium]|nr:DUF2189 domain-containing protein [Xanthobacteraceae bacterium]
MAHSHLLVGASDTPVHPAIRRIRVADLREVLAKGWEDFAAMPTHAVFLCAIYPIVGIVIASVTFGYALLPLLYPLAAGFTLVGPLAAISLYELSRQREAGRDPAAFMHTDILRSRSIGAIMALGVVLLLIFLIWVAAANAIYVANFGYASPESIQGFIRDLFTTSAGWNLIIVGNAVGFLFAVLVLAISVVSFPLLLDRDVGAAVAISTSVRAVLANPVPMATWGLIVAVLLLLGTLPAFLGLTVVLPVLGHATWHLYRKVVDPGAAPPPALRPPPKGPRYAAEFPAALFPVEHR